MNFFRRVKVGQIWRFQTSNGVYMDYEVLEIKDGWVLYKEVVSGAKDYCPIFNFKVGMKLLNREEYFKK
jgi:hypothetical protein